MSHSTKKTPSAITPQGEAYGLARKPRPPATAKGLRLRGEAFLAIKNRPVTGGFLSVVIIIL